MKTEQSVAEKRCQCGVVEISSIQFPFDRGIRIEFSYTMIVMGVQPPNYRHIHNFHSVNMCIEYMFTYMHIIRIYGYRCMHYVVKWLCYRWFNAKWRCATHEFNIIEPCELHVQLYKQKQCSKSQIYICTLHIVCRRVQTLYILCSMYETRHNVVHILFLTSCDNLR